MLLGRECESERDFTVETDGKSDALYIKGCGVGLHEQRWDNVSLGLMWVRCWGQGTLLSQQCDNRVHSGGEAGGGAVFIAFYVLW